MVEVTSKWRNLPEFPRKRQNVCDDIEDIIRRWTVPGENPDTVAFSSLGNLSSNGIASSHRAPVFSPVETITVNGTLGLPWYEGVEPGVRDLLLRVIDTFDCVTYSSCEGHSYPVIAPSRTRDVQILPRTQAEADLLTQRLTRKLSVVDLTDVPDVELVVQGEWLDNKADGSRWAAIRVGFDVAEGSSWRKYFEQLDKATELVTSALDRNVVLEAEAH